MLDSSTPILKPYRHSQPSNATASELAEAILGDGGIYTQLEKRWDTYKAHAQWHEQGFMNPRRGREPVYIDENSHVQTGDKALSPSPLIDKTLTQLVEHCIGVYKEGIVADFFTLAEDNPVYKKRLSELPALTGAAEAEMEKHYARLALQRITARDHSNGHIALSEEAIHRIKDNAEKRLGEYLTQNKKPFHWQSKRIAADNPADDIMVAQARRILRLDETIHPFPYTHNYEHIAYGEKHLLNDSLGHTNFPVALQRERQQRMTEGKSQEDARYVIDRHPETFGMPYLEDKYMTFVGSGALPLTGLMNHIIAGCNINLVDRDPEAVDISRKLVTYLELLGVLEKDAVKIYAADATDLHYGGAHGDLNRAEYAGERHHRSPHVELGSSSQPISSMREKTYVPTDILYIAGLIPNKDKNAILLNLEANKEDPVRSIMVRSARGLSRMLYEPIQDGPFNSNPHYHPHSTLVPERHMRPYGNIITAYQEDAATPASVSAVLSDDNVNTAVMLHRSDLPLLNPHIEFKEGSTFSQVAQKDLGHKPDYSHIDRMRARELLREKSPDKTK